MSGDSTDSVKTAEEDLKEIKEEFQKLEQPPFKVRTFAVNRDGDLISEHSDSDKSQGVDKNGDTVLTDLTNYSVSTKDSSNKLTSINDTNLLSSYTLPETSADTRLSQISEFSNKSSGKSDSMESNPKSSSFTNVTSDPSLDVTGASVLSQYTMNDSKGDQSVRVNDSADDNYIQDRFASLDNLISESKSLIARHKQVIGKTKTMEQEPPALPKQPPPPLVTQREITTSVLDSQGKMLFYDVNDREICPRLHVWLKFNWSGKKFEKFVRKKIFFQSGKKADCICKVCGASVSK